MRFEEKKENTKNIWDDLEYAKKAVQACLDNADTSVDFKGLIYWAEEVERLRDIIRNKM